MLMRIILVILCAVISRGAEAQAVAASTASIADIVNRLTAETDAPSEGARLMRLADGSRPLQMPARTQLRFLYARAGARAQIGRLEDASADLRMAIEQLHQYVPVRSLLPLKRLQVALAIQQRDYATALRLLDAMRDEVDRPRLRGNLFFVYQNMVQASVALGDIAQAKAGLQRLNALQARLRNHPRFLIHGRIWQGHVVLARARICERTGQLGAAIAGYLRVRQLWQQALGERWRWRDDEPARMRIAGAIDLLRAAAGRVKVRLGRTAEGEMEIRQALIASLDRVGQHNDVTLRLTGQLAVVILLQGRFSEAEELAGAARRIRQRMDSIEFPQR